MQNSARPEVDADPASIRDLAYSIIRVLNRQGEAVGPWAGLLSDEELLEGLRNMMTLRAFDARMLMAQRQGKTSFYMQHLGNFAAYFILQFIHVCKIVRGRVNGFEHLGQHQRT